MEIRNSKPAAIASWRIIAGGKTTFASFLVGRPVRIGGRAASAAFTRHSTITHMYMCVYTCMRIVFRLPTKKYSARPIFPMPPLPNLYIPIRRKKKKKKSIYIRRRRERCRSIADLYGASNHFFCFFYDDSFFRAYSDSLINSEEM